MYPIYPTLISRLPVFSLPQMVAETAYEYQWMTERHLHAIWLEQKYFKNLMTAAGQRIEVLSPGIWNLEAGPDFLKAHLRIGAQEIRGDIEIHLSDENWAEHGHHTDERYDGVILHLSLWKPKKEISIRTKSERAIVQTYLEDAFTIPPSRIVQLIDLDLYPYKKFVGSGKCAHSLFRHLSKRKTVQLFGEAAEWRLRQKKKYLEGRTKYPALQFAAGIAMALGYKRNTDAFLDLFLCLYALGENNEDRLLALSLQACGFFSEFYIKKWGDSPKFNHLYGLAMSHALSITHKTTLVLHQIRPLNHPIRRLAVMAKLFSDRSIPFLYQKMLAFWEQRWRKKTFRYRLGEFLQQCREMLPSYEDPYWNSHYIFEKESKNEHIPMIGEGLKNEILVNTFFPLLWDHIQKKKGNFAEARAFFHMYHFIPASNTGKTRYLTHRFFGDSAKGEVFDTAFMEQGAYQLHKDFCLHFEASCEGCPFVERYQKASDNTFRYRVFSFGRYRF